MNTDYLTPEKCEELAGMGYPQGETPYLWHKDKHNHDKWELYKRNPYDMSCDADKFGFNRWVSAVTPEQAKAWRNKQKPLQIQKRNVTIHKFQISLCDGITIDIPGLIKVLSVAVQWDDLVMYALVQPDDKTVTTIPVLIKGTGHVFDLLIEESWEFMGTHVTRGGDLVWHVWIPCAALFERSKT